MSDFYRTVMGHRFYEGTMPALVEQLKRLNDNLEKIITQRGDRHADRSPQQQAPDTGQRA
jgi:hypothetical protein